MLKSLSVAMSLTLSRRFLALLVDIKTSLKKLARTKRSAEFAQTLVMKKKKSFMTLTPEIHIISREKSPSWTMLKMSEQ